MPMATPPSSASGSETIPPMSAAASARSRSPAPEPWPAAVPAPIWNGPTSTAVNAAKPPAMVHTNVDIRRGLTPARAAASGFAADARIARP